MNSIISIIIPVYNVEAYLSECIDSIIGQTYKNLEIILIDDESIDSSGKCCDDYAKKDNRIKVIHKKNGGAASARNEGLKIATGEYLTFVDSDDYLDSNACEYMINKIQEHNADLIQCGLRYVYKNKKFDYRSNILVNELTEFDVETYLKRYTFDWTCGLACDKLFRREIFNGIFYETGHKIDDEFFTYRGVMNAKKIICSPKIFYNYRMRKSSVMHDNTYVEQMLFDKIDYLTKRRKNIVEKFPTLKQDFDLDYLDKLLFLSHDSIITVPVIIKIQDSLNAYLRNEKKCYMKLKFKIILFRFIYSNPLKIYDKYHKDDILRNDNRQDDYFK